MLIAGIQMDIAWEEPKESFALARRQLDRAEAAGARFCVLPEMFATGFSMNAEKVAAFAGEIRAFLAAESSRRGLWLLGGFAESQDPRPRNACALFDPSGIERLHYQKIHPFSPAGEHEHYEGGNSVSSFSVEGVSVTPFICYDLRFPEPFRAAAAHTDLFVVIANWPERRRSAWETLLRARAIENHAFVLGVNRVGEAGGLPHSGDSALIDPLGECRSSAHGSEALVMGEVDHEEVETCRRRFSFLADRRTEVYRELRGY